MRSEVSLGPSWASCSSSCWRGRAVDGCGCPRPHIMQVHDAAGASGLDRGPAAPLAAGRARRRRFPGPRSSRKNGVLPRWRDRPGPGRLQVGEDRRREWDLCLQEPSPWAVEGHLLLCLWVGLRGRRRHPCLDEQPGNLVQRMSSMRTKPTSSPIPMSFNRGSVSRGGRCSRL